MSSARICLRKYGKSCSIVLAPVLATAVAVAAPAGGAYAAVSSHLAAHPAGSHLTGGKRSASKRSRAAKSSPEPIGPGGKWKLTFDDEFNGTSLNTTNWATGWFGSGITDPVNSAEQDCYDPSQVTVSGGSLNLTAVKSSCTTPDGKTFPYKTGAVSSNPSSGAPNQPKRGFQQAHGFFQARIFTPGSSGKIFNWPAWWTDGQQWPADGEMDIVEGLSGMACFHFHSTATGGPGGCPSGSFTGWHTYGADWQPGSVTYYYDGKAVGKVTQQVTSAPMYLILDYAVSSSIGGPSKNATMKVDYVRVWSKA